MSPVIGNPGSATGISDIFPPLIYVPVHDGETTRVVLQLKRVRLFREVTGAYQFSGLTAKCLLAWLRSII